MLEVVTNILSGTLNAIVCASLWSIAASICLIVYCLFAYMCGETWAFLRGMHELTVEIARIVRGRPTSRYRQSLAGQRGLPPAPGRPRWALLRDAP